MTEQTGTATVAEAARNIPVRGTYDVIVAGGGLGGVAAAIASARAGATTLLVERNSFLGGVATAGMCCSIFNCFYTSSHTLGTGGIAVEIADALADATGYGRRWHGHKGHVIYDIERAKLVLMELAEQAGVTLLLQALVAGAIVESGRLRGLMLETKSGREAVLAAAVVDATGDADVAAHSRTPVKQLPPERNLHSLCFRLGNVDTDAFVGYFRDHPGEYPEHMDVDWTLGEALAQYEDCGTLLFPHGGGVQMAAFKQAKANGDLADHIGMHDSTDACQMHVLRQTRIAHVITGFVRFDGLDSATISRSLNDGRRMAFAVAEVYRKYVPGFADAFVAGTGVNLGVRISRFIDGEFVFTRDMMSAGTQWDDAVGRAVGCEHTVKHAGKGAWGVQVMHEDSFDLPYRCLLPRYPDGLIMGAGRSVSAENPSLLRVMVHTMVVGQAAGTAAAVAVASGTSPRDADVTTIQAELRRQGVSLRD